MRYSRAALVQCSTWLAVLAILAVGASASRSDEVIPADPELRWWKGNLHTHTLWSDGNDFPEMIAEWYRTHGYHFLALSDHNILSEGVRWMKLEEVVKRNGKDALDKYLGRFGAHWVETRGQRDQGTFEVRLKPLDEFRALVEERGRFLMISGEEISDQAEGVPVHMNASNLRELIPPVGGSTVREAIAGNLRAAEAEAKRSGRQTIIHVNHPNFGWAITAEDLAAVVAERFFEVYNGHPGVHHEGDHEHASVEQLWDVANTIRLAELASPPLLGVATDDSHNYHGEHGSRPGRGWIMVRARHLTPESLILAIKRADFYASSGVTITDVRYSAESRVLELEILPDGDATFATRFVGTPIGFDSASEPRKDKQGRPIRTTRKYSDQVGQTLAEVEGLHPSYQLTGKELYVRAVVTSSEHHDNPSFEHQHKQAWTQPVGWEEGLKERAAAK